MLKRLWLRLLLAATIWVVLVTGYLLIARI